jgi:hypothetical protein
MLYVFVSSFPFFELLFLFARFQYSTELAVTFRVNNQTSFGYFFGFGFRLCFDDHSKSSIYQSTRFRLSSQSHLIMPPKASKKGEKKAGKAKAAAGGAKRSKKRKESYSIYIYKVLFTVATAALFVGSPGADAETCQQNIGNYCEGETYCGYCNHNRFYPWLLYQSSCDSYCTCKQELKRGSTKSGGSLRFSQYGWCLGHTGSASCCETGYSTENGQRSKDECTAGANGGACQNGGTASGTASNCGCSCTAGFQGANCQTAKSPPPPPPPPPPSFNIYQPSSWASGCPAACKTCQAPWGCVMPGGCCSSSNWCGFGPAWCDSGTDCSGCIPTASRAGSLIAGDDDQGEAMATLETTTTNTQPTSDAEVARTVFEGIIALAILYIAYAVGTKSQPESGMVPNDGEIQKPGPESISSGPESFSSISEI